MVHRVRPTSPARPPTRPRRWLTGAALAAVVGMMGCLGSPRADVPSAMLSQPVASAPRIEAAWRTPLVDSATGELAAQELSTPIYIAATDSVFAATHRGGVFRLRGSTGRLEWSARADGPVHGQLAHDDEHVYFGTLEGTVYALNRDDGSTVWTASTNGSVGGAAAVSQGRVFFTNSSNELIALDARTGKELWTYSRPSTESLTVVETGSPVVHDDVVLIGFHDGMLAAVQIDTGEPIWLADLAADEQEFLDVDRPVVIQGDRVFAASYAGGMYAIDLGSGEVEWRTPVESISAFEQGDGMVYIASALGRIVALDADNGEPAFSFKFEEHLPVDLTVTDRFIIASTGSGPLYFLDRLSGLPLTTWNPSSGVQSRFVVGPEKSFALSNGGLLYGLTAAF